MKARRRRPLKLSQYWLGSPDLVLANLLKIIGRRDDVCVMVDGEDRL